MSPGPPVGFAGIVDLAGDVGQELKRLAGDDPPPLDGTLGSNTTPPPLSEGPTIADDGSRRRAWWLGVGAATIVLIYIVGAVSQQSGGNTTPESAVESPPPSQNIAASAQATPTAVPNATTQVTGEEEPGVADGANLTTNQIAYCLAENIRIDGARRSGGSFSSDDVTRFNGLVSDYNSRCGHFLYDQGSMDQARAYVEQRRTALMDEGSARFPAKPPSPPPLMAAPADGASDAQPPTTNPPTEATASNLETAPQ